MEPFFVHLKFSVLFSFQDGLRRWSLTPKFEERLLLPNYRYGALAMCAYVKDAKKGNDWIFVVASSKPDDIDQ